MFVNVFVFLQLVELNGDARMKLSQDIEKVTIPGKKDAFRLYGGDGESCIERGSVTKILTIFMKMVQQNLCVKKFGNHMMSNFSIFQRNFKAGCLM